MSSLKKLAKLGLILSYCLIFFGTANAQTITLAYVDFPPYEYKEGNEAKGILVTIVKDAFEKAGIPLRLRLYPFKRALESAKTGSIDGLFNFYKNEERLKYFDYSEPLIKNQLMFFVKKDSTIAFNSIEDLKGLTIGVMRGYTYGSEFDKSPLFSRQEATRHQSHLKKLAINRIDAYPCDQLVGIHIAKEEGIMSELKILPKPLKELDGHIGFTKGKHTEVLQKINQVIIEMKRDGTIKKLIDDYVSQSTN